MFEKKTRRRVELLLEEQFSDIREWEQSLKNSFIDVKPIRTVPTDRSTNERNMTRKTRTRRPQIHSVFQSGYCAVCHQPYNSLGDHIQSKRHLKLIGDDESFISLKGLDCLLALDDVDDAVDVNVKNCDYSPPRRRSKMPRTRASSMLNDRLKDSPLSPVGSESGHRLRSRKNINYMTPPLDEDSLTEKPEVVKEYKELRSSSRLLAKLSEQMIESDEVWNSGRPKRACNRQRISADERLVADNKNYYRVEVLPSKLRSRPKRPDTPDDKELVAKFKKLRNSELTRLNNEAENFLFPKKDVSSDEDSDDDLNRTDNSSISELEDIKKIKMEDDESMHSTGSESRGKKRRRTHAEAFIMDNQKYYKFETPGSRLRYQGSYLSPVPMKKNGDCFIKNEDDKQLNLDEYNFSFENVPKNEAWYQAFERRDRGEEKYVFLSDDMYWNPFILPYQLRYIAPLDPRECIAQYNQIKKCLMEPQSASTSVTCSTPDPASNSSVETPFHQDEDSKISVASSTSTEEKSPKRNKRVVNTSGNGGKNPRKSPRQHASTLAILSSLIQQRKRKSKIEFQSNLPTILEEPKKSPKKKVDLVALLKSVEEELSVCDEKLLDVDIEKDEEIEFKRNLAIDDIFKVDVEPPVEEVKVVGKPGRKPGKRKKNRTGWPLNRARRVKKEIVKEDDDSTVDSISVNSECEEATDRIKKSENNNQTDQSSLDINCDLNEEDRVGRVESDEKVLTTKVNNGDGGVTMNYQPYVRVQKLDNHIDNCEPTKRSTSPKRTNRGQRRMPASPKSPRMLRRPRGRWYRER